MKLATQEQLMTTGGSTVYQDTRDLRMVQELLGHSSVQSTQGYVALRI